MMMILRTMFYYCFFVSSSFIRKSNFFHNHKIRQQLFGGIVQQPQQSFLQLLRTILIITTTTRTTRTGDSFFLLPSTGTNRRKTTTVQSSSSSGYLVGATVINNSETNTNVMEQQSCSTTTEINTTTMPLCHPNDNDSNNNNQNNQNVMDQDDILFDFKKSVKQSNSLLLYHIQDRPILSTQDEARRILHELYNNESNNNNNNNNNDHVIDENHIKNKYVTVIADYQTNGRGTQGRKWESKSYPNQNKEEQEQEQKQNKIEESHKIHESTCATSANTTCTTTASGSSIMKKEGDDTQETNNNNNQTTLFNGTNLFLTICIPMDEIPVQLSLFPLQIGIIVAQKVEQLIHSCSSSSVSYDHNDDPSQHQRFVTVKWPNDVLVQQNKISGTLIENEIIQNKTNESIVFMLIGIGVNVAYRPDLRNTPGKHTRSPACVQDYCTFSKSSSSSPIEKTETTTTSSSCTNSISIQNHTRILPFETSALLGIDIASTLVDWIVQNQHLNNKKNRNIHHTNSYEVQQNRYRLEKQIVTTYRSYSVFQQQYEIRGRHVQDEQMDDGTSSSSSYQGEIVTTINIQDDGQLIVLDQNGQEKVLNSEYLF